MGVLKHPDIQIEILKYAIILPINVFSYLKSLPMRDPNEHERKVWFQEKIMEGEVWFPNFKGVKNSCFSQKIYHFVFL